MKPISTHFYAVAVPQPNGTVMFARPQGNDRYRDIVLDSMPKSTGCAVDRKGIEKIYAKVRHAQQCEVERRQEVLTLALTKGYLAHSISTFQDDLRAAEAASAEIVRFDMVPEVLAP